MKNDGFVRWQKWEPVGLTEYGQMRLKDVSKNLVRFAEIAKEELRKSGADHAIYGLKEYDENGDLELVRFYMGITMNDEEFQKDVASLKGCTVYALHKGTASTEKIEANSGRKTLFKDRYFEIFESRENRFSSRKDKVERLAQLIYANDRTRNKEDCLVQALEEFELMSGSYWDPTHDEYDEVLASII